MFVLQVCFLQIYFHCFWFFERTEELQFVGVCAITNESDGAEGVKGAKGVDGGTTRCVCGERGYALKFGTRSIMVSSMRGNDVGDVDGNVAFKAGDVGDNGGMTCEGEVSKGGVEYVGGMKVWEGGMENSCGMEVSGGGVEYSSGIEVSSVEQPAARPPDRRPPCSLTRLGQP